MRWASFAMRWGGTRSCARGNTQVGRVAGWGQGWNFEVKLGGGVASVKWRSHVMLMPPVAPHPATTNAQPLLLPLLLQARACLAASTCRASTLPTSPRPATSCRLRLPCEASLEALAGMGRGWKGNECVGLMPFSACRATKPKPAPCTPISAAVSGAKAAGAPAKRRQPPRYRS